MVMDGNLVLRTASVIYSPLSWCSTARGSSTGLVPVGPTKVKVRNSVLFTEGTPKVEIDH